MYQNIAYQSFCWVLGTTSFRTAQLNLKIEQQLIMLSQLQNKYPLWRWDNQLQVIYYDFMKENQFIQGNATYKDKDAREKTSGLVDIGLLTNNRQLTAVGKELLTISQNSDFNKNNFFQLEADSYLYFKQLLKASLTIGNNTARPYIVLAKILTHFGYLSYNEFTYFLPLCTSNSTTQYIIEQITQFRQNKQNITDTIYQTLMQLDNYQNAFDIFINNQINENLICTIGMNRKSRNYDKPYYELFLSLYHVFIEKQNSQIINLYHAAKKTKQHKKWLNLLLDFLQNPFYDKIPQ